MDNEVAALRTKTLSDRTGLTVEHYRVNGVNYFQFFRRDGNTLKTVCTYGKARLFAQGYVAGRNSNV